MNRTKTNHSRLRGFTLVELMVALTGGIFFTVFVFMMTRDSSRFFQSQARLSETTLATVSGFERLRADIARAGFLASPNLARDQRRCPRPPSGGTAVTPQQFGTQMTSYRGLQQMGLARVIEGQTRLDHATNYSLLNSGASGLSPDQLVLYGNYTTAEQFAVRSADLSGAPPTLTLEPLSNPVQRLGLTGVAAADNIILGRIFKPDSILRLVDRAGREQYSIVDNATLDLSVVPPAPAITLKGMTIIEKTSAEGATCGTRLDCKGCMVNPVDIVRYQLEDTQNAALFPQFRYLHDGSGPAYDNTRLDLVRYTLSPAAANQLAATTDVRQSAEMVAEYAVDLKFGASVLQQTATLGSMEYLAEGDTALRRFFGEPDVAPSNGAGENGPHFIRGIHARLSIRDRMADREFPVVANGDPQDLFRVQVASGKYARLRTLRSHIATRNTQNITWN